MGRVSEEIRSLDELEPEFGSPPAIVVVALAALTLGACMFFVKRGFDAHADSDGRLAARLLQVEPRDLAPTGFDLESMSGGKVDLSKLNNKVVFLNFWATWCPPCIEEMPSMERLHRKLKDEPNFEMVAVSVDKQWAEVRNFFRSYRPAFSIVLDPGGSIASKYGSSRFPETYVIVDGKIRAFIEGPRDWDAWYAEAYLRDVIDRHRARKGTTPVALLD